MEQAQSVDDAFTVGVATRQTAGSGMAIEDEDADEQWQAEDNENVEDRPAFMSDTTVSFGESFMEEDEGFEDVMPIQGTGLVDNEVQESPVQQQMHNLEVILNKWDEEDNVEGDEACNEDGHGFELQQRYMDECVFHDIHNSLAFVLS